MTRVLEETRTVWAWTPLEQLAQDVRYAFRTMIRNRTFTALAAISLALGIGANTAIYSFMDSILLRSLPVSDPASLVVVKWRSRPCTSETAPGKRPWSNCSPRCTSHVGRDLRGRAPLARVPADEWRARLAGAFQDFFRFEFRARQTVGLGDVPRLDDGRRSSRRSSAPAPATSSTRLRVGTRHAARPDVARRRRIAFGQWQKLALARGFMRDEPLLLVLDEPTAALDAETEHALFERYAAAARATRRRRRARSRSRVAPFSTVRMADLIVVLDGARLVEVGTHETLDGDAAASTPSSTDPGRGVPLDR